jgi:hypothetical protein
MQAIASPREMLLNKVPFPLPTPSIFNLDQINAFSVDNLVSKDGEDLISSIEFYFIHCILLILFQHILQLSLSRTWASCLRS